MARAARKKAPSRTATPQKKAVTNLAAPANDKSAKALGTEKFVSQPVILFEPNGYLPPERGIMGRQAAGMGFLRTVVDHHKQGVFKSYSYSNNAPEILKRLLGVLGHETSDIRTLRPSNQVELAQSSVLHRPDAILAEMAFQRLRLGANAYSITGVTHTTASKNTMEAIKATVAAPLMPWDALICTSQSVQATVKAIVEAEQDYLTWATGGKKFTMPRFPVIPLGVHTKDFEHKAEVRPQVREKLGIKPNEVAVLFLGRLSFHAKAHPIQMYKALQRATQSTGKEIVLLECGWHANEFIKNAFAKAAQDFMPNVRTILLNGKDARTCNLAWSAADMFMSISDNLQETFGITPLEAMAAGIPSIVSDWDGYKDTVRDGIDGFRIPTFMPDSGNGEPIAESYETEKRNYDHYCFDTCMTVSVDQSKLDHAVKTLIENPEKRQKMGAAGHEHVRKNYDWAVIYKQYQELWQELHETRIKDGDKICKDMPKCNPSHLDPYDIFKSYPTNAITLGSKVVKDESVNIAQLLNEAYIKGSHFIPNTEELTNLIEALKDQPQTIRQINKEIGLDDNQAIRGIAFLAKLGALKLE